MSIQSEARARLVSDLAAELVAAGPSLDEPGKRITLAVYRLLAGGDPVPAAAIAKRLGMTVEEVETILDAWPGVYRDDQGGVIGFWGLSLGEMPHRLIVDGHTLFTWCAWDALFIPPLLGRAGRVESRCAVTDDPVTLTVSPSGVTDVSPSGVVLSLLRPDGGFGDDVISSFCHQIVFFRSQADGERWTATHPGTFVLSLAEGFRLGQLAWHDRLTGVPEPITSEQEDTG
jgi:alkylmercury lyase